MSPESYLLSGGRTCYLGLMSNPDGDIDGDQCYLMGDAFLRHFYQVYDYDSQKVMLAVDAHSEGIVSIGEAIYS